MNGFTLRYVLIKSIRDLYRAVFYTSIAARTFGLYGISGLFNQGYSEVSFFPFNIANFSITQDLYIGMPADLDQFGRQYSNGALIGGKGLVKLGHPAANGRSFVNHVNLKTRIAKIECGLNTADPPTDNHHIAKIPC
jgi:hypothetical protein